MAVNTLWFRNKLEEKHLSQRGLARLMGLDSSAISLMLRGRREMKITEAAKIAALIGVPAEEVMANIGVNLANDGANVPIVATLDGVGEVLYRPSDGLGTVARPHGEYPTNLSAIVCRTTGSPLDYMDRWILLYECVREGVDPNAIERMSLVKPRGSVPCLGQVRRSYIRGRWDVSGPITVMTGADLEYATPILLIMP